MKKIGKDDLKNLLLNELKTNNPNYDSLDLLINNLYNLSNELVYPLNEVETFALRKRFGILDNGKIITKAEIAHILNTTPPNANNILQRAMTKVIRYIEYNNILIQNNKMTSIDNLENQDAIKNILLLSLDLDTKLINRLTKNNIKTLNDVLGFSLREISEMFGPIVAENLNVVITRMGLHFLDKLPVTSKMEIINKADLSVIYNSSIYWLFDLNIDKTIFNNIKAKNIKEFLVSIDTLPNDTKRKIISCMSPVRYMIMDKINNESKKSK